MRGAARLALAAVLLIPPLCAWQTAAQPHQAPPARAAAKPKASTRTPAVPAPALLQSVPLEGTRLSNGIQLYLAEDHDLPLVYGAVLWKGGTAFDPPDQPGLAELTLRALRAGGTRALAPDDLERSLDAMGAHLDTDLSSVEARLSFSGLGEHSGDLLRLVRDLLETPGFRLEKVELIKTEMRDVLAARPIEPLPQAHRQLAAALYGHDTPLGEDGNSPAIARFRAADVRGFFRRHCVPAGLTLVLAGDFDAARLRGELGSLFGAWNGPAAAPGPPAFQAPTAAGALVVPGKNIARTAFALGLLGPEWRDRDSAVWAVLMQILGEDLRGRVSARIPSTPDNPSGINAAWLPQLAFPGLAEIYGITASFQFPEVLQMVPAAFERLRTAEVSDGELRSAQQQLLEGLALDGDSAPKRLTREAGFRFFDYPAGFVTGYERQILAVTRADVLRLAKDRLDWSRFTLTAVGDADGIRQQFAAAGRTAAPLQTAAAAFRPAPEMSDPEAARKLLERAIAAAGGAEKLSALKDVTRDAEWLFTGGAGGYRIQETATWMPPNAFRQEVHSPLGRVILYTDGKAGWISNGRGSNFLSGSNFERARADLFRLYPRLLLSAGIAGRSVGAADDNTVEMREGGLTAYVTFDPSTGLASKLLYESATETGIPIAVEEDLLDYREVAGLKLPFQMKIVQNGRTAATVTVKEWKVDQGLKLMDLLRQP